MVLRDVGSCRAEVDWETGWPTVKVSRGGHIPGDQTVGSSPACLRGATVRWLHRCSGPIIALVRCVVYGVAIDWVTEPFLTSNFQ